MKRWVAAVMLALGACGSRTGLLAPDEHPGASDSGADAGVQADVSPPLDVQQEPFVECPDAGSTLVYLITTQNVLMSFYPPTGGFTTIGTIQCPTYPQDSPFSMAVDRRGIAYVMFTSGQLFQVNTADASCQATAFSPPLTGGGPLGGMAFAANPLDAGTQETLYIDDDNVSALDTLDTSTFQLTTVAALDPVINQPELTGNGAGELFAFYKTDGGVDSAIAQLDRLTAQIVGVAPLPGVSQGNAWAFAFWGGDFYTFTAPLSRATVQRYRPSDGSVVTIASLADAVVGAGVSTCAPQM